MMRRDQIAAVIERDLLRADDGKPSDAIKCFACGRGMTYKGNRFCSDHCRAYYDNGAPGPNQDWLRLKPDYGITGWKVVTGPPSIEIGSDYYQRLRVVVVKRGQRRLTSRRNRQAARRIEPNKVPNYIVRANGHGYWQPSATSRSLGFTSVDCGFDGDEARSKARALNEAARDARKQGMAAENTKREAA
jgi:hypothetical protein